MGPTHGLKALHRLDAHVGNVAHEAPGNQQGTGGFQMARAGELITMSARRASGRAPEAWFQRDVPLPGRIPALDGVRGMAILLVLLFHLNLLRTSTTSHAVDDLMSTLLAVGWCGVDLFFVLSGYLITRILYEAKGSDSYFRNFFIGRILRIFPLYYALLLFTFVVVPNLPAGLIPAETLDEWVGLEHSPLWFWLYLSNFAIASAASWGHGTLDVTWSLGIEEQFYFLWPSVVCYLNRKRLLKICLGVVVAAFAIRVVMTVGEMSPVSTYVFTLGRFDAIAAGAFVALAGAGSGGIDRLFPACRIWGMTAAALAGLFLWRGTNNLDPIVLTVGLSLVALNFAALLAIILSVRSNHWLVRLFSLGWLRSFGKYSYAMYLVHVPVAAGVRELFYGPNDFPSLVGSRIPGQILFYLLTTTLIFTLAFVSWHLCEKHFLRLRRSTVFRTRSPAYASGS